MSRYELAIEEGRVTCPITGEVDFERCTTCSRFLKVSQHDGREAVLCRSSGGVLAALDLLTDTVLVP